MGNGRRVVVLTSAVVKGAGTRAESAGGSFSWEVSFLKSDNRRLTEKKTVPCEEGSHLAGKNSVPCEEEGHLAGKNSVPCEEKLLLAEKELTTL